jgi:hypothetical protein
VGLPLYSVKHSGDVLNADVGNFRLLLPLYSTKQSGVVPSTYRGGWGSPMSNPLIGVRGAGLKNENRPHPRTLLKASLERPAAQSGAGGFGVSSQWPAEPALKCNGQGIGRSSPVSPSRGCPHSGLFNFRGQPTAMRDHLQLPVWNGTKSRCPSPGASLFNVPVRAAVSERSRRSAFCRSLCYMHLAKVFSGDAPQNQPTPQPASMARHRARVARRSFVSTRRVDHVGQKGASPSLK